MKENFQNELFRKGIEMSEYDGEEILDDDEEFEYDESYMYDLESDEELNLPQDINKNDEDEEIMDIG